MDDRHALVDEVKRAVLDQVDIETVLAAKTKSLLQKGGKAFSELRKQQQELADKMSEALDECQERQRSLQDENAKLIEVQRALQVMASSLCAQMSGTPTGAATGVPGLSVEAASGQGAGSPQQATAGSTDLSWCAGLLGPPPLGVWPPCPTSPCGPGAAVTGIGAGGGIFSFSLRKADGIDLGLKVSHREGDQALLVESMLPGSAVEAWNKQCAGGACQERAVMPGDRIVAVNDAVGDFEKMLEECRNKRLLRLTVARAAPGPVQAATTAPAPMLGQRGPCTLRAGAPQFMPAGLGQNDAKAKTLGAAASPPKARGLNQLEAVAESSAEEDKENSENTLPEADRPPGLSDQSAHPPGLSER